MPLDESILGSTVPFDPREAADNMINHLSGDALGTPVDTDMAVDRLTRKMLRPTAPEVTPPTSKASAGLREAEVPDLSDLGIPLDQAEDLSSLGTPYDPDAMAPLPKVEQPAEAPKHYAFTRGLVSGMLKQNPESAAEALEGLSHLAPSSFKDSLNSGSRSMRDLSKLSPKDYETKAGSLWDAKNFDDALAWAGETFGAGLASTGPSIVGGLLGAGAGAVTPIPGAAMVGGKLGASAPSAMLNYGQVYKALKDEKVSPEKAAEYAAYAALPMTALDVMSVGPIIDRLGGLKEVKAQLARTIAKRIAAEAAKGAGREGITEGLQQVVQDATVSLASDKPFWTMETAKDVGENMLGGALVGGGIGGVSGIKADKVAAAPASAPAAGAAPSAGAGPTGPSAGPQPGPGPSAGGPGVSVRQAQAAPKPDQGPDPSAMSEAEKLHAYAASRESHGGAREADILKTAGFDDEQIARMSDEARVEAVIRAAKPQDGTDQTAQPGPGPEQAEAAQPSPDDEEYSLLRAGGYTDENIADMSAKQRAYEANYYRNDLGLDPADAVKRYPRPQAKPETTAQPETDDRGATIEPTGKDSFFVRSTDDRGDMLSVVLKPDALKVSVATVGKKTRGQGVATTLYEKALEMAAQRGVPLRSDLSVSPAAAQVYEALKRRGYNVIEADGTLTHADGGKTNATTGYVYEVTPKSKETGNRNLPIKATSADDVLRASETVAPNPTEAQAKAENYKHAHVDIEPLGLTGRSNVSIETGVGGVRRGTDPDGKAWEVTMPAAYGRIKGTKGADGQPLDIFIGPNPTSNHVFIVDQHHPNGGGFDEHKIMAGFVNPRAALEAYKGSYADNGGDRIGGVTALTADEFKAWIKSGDHTTAFKKIEPVSSTHDEDTGSVRPLTEAAAGEAAVPKEGSQEGAHPATTSEDHNAQDGDTVPDTQTGNAEILPPARVTAAEATQDHHDQIEAVLGRDYDHVLPADAARAAEILADNPGMPPALAFEHAVIDNAVSQGYLTTQEATEVYGTEVQDVLESEQQATSERSGDTEQESAVADEKPAGDAKETGVVSGGSETGTATRGENTERDQPDTGRGTAEQPDTERQATGAASEDQTENVKSKIEDAGEKIGGARKDAWIGRGLDESDLAGMTGAELDKHVTKHNIWQRPDYVQAVEEGVEPKAAALLKRIYDGIGVKPNVGKYGKPNDPAIQKLFITALKAVRDVAREVKTVDDIRKLDDRVSSRLRELKSDSWDAINSIKKPGARTSPLYVSGRDLRWAEKAVADGFPNAEPWTRLFVVQQETRWPTEKDKTAFNAAFAAAGSEFEKAGVSLDLTYGRNSEPSTIALREWKGTKAVDVDSLPPQLRQRYSDLLDLRDAAAFGKEWATHRKSGGVIGRFKTKEAAEDAAKATYEGLSEERKKGGEEPNRPHLDRIERSGPDYRAGRDVDSEDFIKDFGFRGVEFGNWVASDERQKVVNLGYDALHDLARALGVPPKAISLDGTLSVAFGARGRGGRAAAHYESDRTVINMTKLSGAGSLAHEWGHALDHYLGEQASRNPYASAVQSISGWRDTPSNPRTHWMMHQFEGANSLQKRKLRVAANRLMHTLFNVMESDDAFETRMSATVEANKKGQQGWINRVDQIKERMKKGGSRAGLKQAETQVEVWGREIERSEKMRERGERKAQPSQFVAEATKLSGTTGDYWRRPNEMFARSFESYVFDKLAAEGFTSQYLVQGVEPNRYGAGFKGNPYPVGDERTAINAAYDRLLRAITVGEGKLGAGTRLQAAEGEPEPIETVTKVNRPQAQPTAKDEAEAVDQASKPLTLTGAFASHFITGGEFKTIVEARKFAKDAGFTDDPKAIEEAIEAAIVRVARQEIVGAASKKAAFRLLTTIYSQQPRLGTRTSTSVRDQAYSTPVPLAYLAAELAGITKETTVYEPTAGNGALLITANPALVKANEINPERRESLKSQGYKTHGFDAANKGQFAEPNSMDVVIANPPFGAVREGNASNATKVFDLSDIQPGYQTHEIDHAIALRSLAAMKGNGRAVLILGGINKLATTETARSDAYNGKAKRQFYKVLYDNYGVTDHFTVSGDLYERQGAGWPVDVIVIEGRKKSSRALPAADVPRIYKSWSELGGVLDGIRRQEAGDGGPAVTEADSTSGIGSGVEGESRADRGDAGRDQSGVGQPGQVRDQRRAAGDADTGAAGDQERVSADAGQRSDRLGEQPAAERPSHGLSDDFEDIFNDALDAAYGPAETAAKAKTTRKPRDTRATEDVAKSAAQNATDAADAAFSGLYQLFGGPKVSSGFTFDEETYKKAKPLFEQAAQKFKDFLGDTRELVNRMIAHMRDTLQWPREVMARMGPYLKRFIQELNEQPAQDQPQPKAKAKPQQKAVETENQVTYHPKSKMGSLDTLVPVNMRRSIDDALTDLEDRVGPIDTFVANELDYDDPGVYFGAEQIDAIGLAIDNLKRGKGFIIGDQTGIGKGRVNAAIIRWAIMHDRIPVFVTEKPGLYADMYRDMKDIGLFDKLPEKEPRILATNTGLKLPLDDAGTAKISNGDAKAHGKLMSAAATTDYKEFAKTHDMVFTNYSQMQTVKGEDTTRRQFLKAIIGNAVMIFDESHNAGGQQTASRKSANTASNRSGFARELVQGANGVFYSSATYAKRPDVMDLYAATDMAMAVDDLSNLAEAIQRGGVPMQQVVATMLAEAGQYIRRERSFDGITYNTPIIAVNRANYDQISSGLSAIQDLSKYVAEAAANVSMQLKAEGQALGYDGATGDAGASSTSFTAVMHNVINQMLLAMKVEGAAQRAIAAIKAGEKVVMTVANTMESFLSDYADTVGISNGEEIPADFSDVLMKYLDRTRTIIIKKPFVEKGEKSTYRHYLTDGELGSAGVATYNKAKAIIAGMDLSDLPVSPIDYLKGRLQAEGYKVGEITGRGLVVDYTGKVPVLRTRPGSETSTKGRNASRAAFNKKPAKGGLHAIIINQAGSTGISMHASSTFDDQSKRRMIVVQPEGNIDTHMQLLGRVNRTGQVVLPEYDQLVADIPAEKRPAAVLAKKMASLNANTTASRSSALTSKEVPDFVNEYGDEVAISYLADNLEMNPRLAFPVKISESGKFEKEDAMRKLTGRIPLLPLSEQEDVYDHLESEYAALIHQLEAAGENALEAKTVDLKAKTIETAEVQGKRNESGSPFAAPVIMEKVSIVRPGKPYKPLDLINRVHSAIEGREVEGTDDNLDMLAKLLQHIDDRYSTLGRKTADNEHKERTEAVKDFTAYTRAILDDIDDQERKTKEITKFNAIKDRFEIVHQLVPIGRRVTLKTASGNLIGIVIAVDHKGEAKNPLALSTWKVTFAVPDATKTVTLPFSRISEDGKADPESILDVEVVPMTPWYEAYKATLERFAFKQTEAREERYIATGNLLAAYDWLDRRGSILNYTDNEGHIRQGVLTSRDFELAEHAIKKGRVLKEPVEIRQWLDGHPGEDLHSDPDFVQIKREGRWTDNYVIAAHKAKAKGGRYYLDKDLTQITGDFYSRSGMMIGEVKAGSVMRVVERLQALGAQFKVPAVAPKVNKVTDEPMAAMARSNPTLTREAELKKGQIQRDVTAIVRTLVGPNVDLEFHDGLIPVKSATGWGSHFAGQARGLFYRNAQLIRLALSGSEATIASTAFHESYHAMEFLLQTPAERLLMERETPRLRRIVQQQEGYSDDDIAQLNDAEVRAVAFENYALIRATKRTRKGTEHPHVGIRRLFDRMLDFVRRVGNALRGLGFRTYEDIFNDGFEGEYRNREPDGSGTQRTDDEPMAALAGGGSGGRPPHHGGPAGPNSFDDSVGDLVGRHVAQILPAIIARQNMTALRVKLQDKFIRIQKAEESVGNTNTALSAYQAETLYYGRTGQRIETLEDNHIDPLIRELKGRNIELDEFNDYLYALHVRERNEHIGAMYEPGHQFNDAINDTSIVGASGVSTDEAEQFLADIATSGRMADFQAAESRVRDIQNRTLNALLNYGLITQEVYDSLRQTYRYYVPLRGFAESMEDEHAIRTGKGYDTRGKEFKTAFGRKSKADGPLQYILLQAEMAIVRGEKNRVGNTFLRLVQNNPDPDRWVINRPKMVPRVDRTTGMISYVPDNFDAYNNPRIFITKLGGKPYYIEMKGADGENITRALKTMGTAQVHTVVRMIGNLTRMMARLATSWNPNFMIRNFARDVGEAFVNLGEVQQRAMVSKFRGHLLKAVYGSARAMAGKGAGDPYVDAFHEFDRAGGRIRFFGLDDTDDFTRNINRKMKRLQGGIINGTLDKGEAIVDAVEIANGGIENGTRLAAFMAAKDIGMSTADAANLAINLTINFTRRGEWGSVINSLYMFANAGIQGIARMAQAVRYPRVRRSLYTMAAASFAVTIYSIMMGGDDDDGDNNYLSLPPWERDKNLILMWPKGVGGFEGYGVKIPLPISYAPFAVAGSHLASVLLGKESVGKALNAVGSAMVDMLNPFGHDENWVAAFMPSIVRPQIHIRMNQNWTGNPLYPDAAFNKGKPDSAQAFRSTSGFSKEMAKKLNEWTGGNTYQPGAIDVHPASLDHWLQTITGGLGQFVKQTVQSPIDAYNGEWKPSKAPIIGGFIATGNTPQAKSAAYYEARKPEQDRQAEVQRARRDMKAGINVDESRKFIEDNDNRPAANIFKQADKQMSNLRKREARITTDASLSSEERKEQISEIRADMRRVQTEARKRSQELKRQGP